MTSKQYEQTLVDQLIRFATNLIYTPCLCIDPDIVKHDRQSSITSHLSSFPPLQTTSTYNEDIIRQLMAFGYSLDAIIHAMDTVTNKNDINQILEQIEEQSSSESITSCTLSHTECTGNNTDTCPSVNQVINALLLYQTLDLDNTQHQQQLIQYCNETNTRILDDYIHLVTKHSHQVSDIYDLISIRTNVPCNLAKCSSAIRHHRDRDKPTPNDVDTQVMFWMDVMDSCHCYLSHLYDLGLRININSAPSTIDRDMDHTDPDYDTNLANIHKILKATRVALNELDGLKLCRYQNNRFDLSITQHANSATHTKTTFMDGLYTYMQQQRMDHKDIISLQNTLYDEDYDSEAMQMDLLYGTLKDSNILQWFTNSTHSELLQQYVHQIQLSSMCFRVGLRFYYWDYYKDQDETYIQTQQGTNVHDHYGYSPKQLYIAKKYNSLRTEILHNKISRLTRRQFALCITKTHKYYSTAKAKTITADRGVLSDFLHYGIEKGTSLTKEHLLSVVLYTDWSKLSTAFSATFRRQFEYETLYAIKSRNREFANWSRLLREAVEYFGNCGFFDEISDRMSDDERKEYDFESGPFFCGISEVMVIPEFNIRLNAPTSTTKQIEVAQRFSGDDGIILQLNNDGYFSSFCLTSWNCAWLSSFNEEDERIWFGGYSTIKVESILTVSDSLNYQRFLQPLFYLDSMMTGNQMNTHFQSSDITDSDYTILSHLIQFQKHQTNACKFPKYIYDTFLAFTRNKTQIVINIGCIAKYFDKLRNLVMSEISNKPYLIPGNGHINLLKPALFHLFPNLRSIVINSAEFGSQYSLDIAALLDVLNDLEHPPVNLIIRARHQYIPQCSDDTHIVKDISYVAASWLHMVWDNLSHIIEAKCKEKQYDVSFVPDISIKYDSYEILEDQLTIVT
eukprot:663099_1